MRLVLLFRVAYLLLGVLCFGSIPFESSGCVQVFPKIYASIICMCFIGLDCWPKKEISRVLNSIFLLSVASTMLFPFTVLSAWPELYLKAGTPYAMSLYMEGIPVHVHLILLTYIFALSFCFTAMVKVLEGQIQVRHFDALQSARSGLFKHFRVIAIVAILSNVFYVLFTKYTGQFSYDSTVGAYGFVARLFSSELLTFIAIYSYLKYKNVLGREGHFLIVCVIGVAFISGFVGGQRGVILKFPYWILLILFFLNPNFRIPIRRLVAISTIGVLLLPVGFSAVSISKIVLRDRSVYKADFSVDKVVEMISGDVYYKVFGWVGGRFSGYQILVAAETSYGSHLREMASPLTIAKSTISNIFPNSMLPRSFVTLSLGQIASVVVSGHQVGEVKHSGNFFGVTMMWLYLRYTIVFVLAVSVCGYNFLYNSWFCRSDYYGALLCFSAILIFNLMLSGNVDRVLGDAFTSVCVVSFLWIVVNLVRGNGRVGRV